VPVISTVPEIAELERDAVATVVPDCYRWEVNIDANY